MVAEVIAVFAAVHVGYRAFKRFTPMGHWESDSGLNFSPGVFMIATSLLILLLLRRKPSDFGLVFTRWREHVPVGLVLGVTAALGSVAIVVLGRFQITPGKPPPDGLALIGAGGELALSLVMLVLLRRDQGHIARFPRWLTCLAFASICTMLPALAAFVHKPIGHALALTMELLVCAGFGEEVFFRGYMQSRVNMAFGTPWRLLGVDFGPGLVISATMFGIIHALNTADYFVGRFDVAWAWGLMNVCNGLCLGLLRERTRSVLASSVAHATTNMFLQLPQFLPRH
ncbi:MAG: CPBP family intramembrane glutamic endopeptidase [Planctomycetota bacterium]|nr:CPBP family intramembrane glutamic endopeptidase [Planctomycetota bacterium]